MDKIISYGKQTLDESDIKSVMDVLNENLFLTTGPYVTKFEQNFAKYCNSKYAVAVNSGTSALHCAIACLDIDKDDEIIVSDISFVASANCVLYCGGKPVFCDIRKDTLNIDPDKIESLITSKTRAIVCVDMCGQVCEYNKILDMCKRHNLILIEDAAHSLGANGNCLKGKPKVGSFADLTCFSFHPVKNMTTGEGGMITTNDKDFYRKMKAFRSHGINKDYKHREKDMSYYYDMEFIGYNYRLSDILCALGISQLKKLDNFVNKRKEISKRYDSFFSRYSIEIVEPIKDLYDNSHHLYVVRVKNGKRDGLFTYLYKKNIRCNVHYRPIHMHKYYKDMNINTYCPNAEEVYTEILSLPIYPNLTDTDFNTIVQSIGYFLSM